MTNIIVNAGLTSNLICGELTRTGDFRVTNLPQTDWSGLEKALRDARADMLLLNVGMQPARITFGERERQIRLVRREFPKCKIILLIDTNVGEKNMSTAVTLKQAGLIDSFIFSDCSKEYITATLQSIII